MSFLYIKLFITTNNILFIVLKSVISIYQALKKYQNKLSFIIEKKCVEKKRVPRKTYSYIYLISILCQNNVFYLK